jgi:hypothetical protein
VTISTTFRRRSKAWTPKWSIPRTSGWANRVISLRIGHDPAGYGRQKALRLEGHGTWTRPWCVKKFRSNRKVGVKGLSSRRYISAISPGATNSTDAT